MQRIAAIVRHFHSDSLYRNSIYLMMSTAIMSLLGFFFWIINARLFSPQQVGIATTLISTTNLLATFNLIGLNQGIIKYLSNTTNKNTLLNSVLLTIIATSVISSSIFIIGVESFSPKLTFLNDNLLYSIIFIFFIIIASLNSITDSIFISERRTIFIFIINSIFSLVKLILPVTLVSFGFFGIYYSFIGGTTVAMILSFFILIKLFKYNFGLYFNIETIKKILKFSFVTYLAGLLGTIPGLFLPIIILNKLGAENSAYFYMSMMIANILYIIPQSVNLSLFAEGSNEADKLREKIIKAVKIIPIFLLPALILIITFGHYVLLSFGKNYSSESFTFLKLLSLTSIFISINSIFSTVFKVKNYIKELLVTNSSSLIVILFLSNAWVHYGLKGIGFAWLLGNITAMFVGLIFIRRLKLINI